MPIVNDNTNDQNPQRNPQSDQGLKLPFSTLLGIGFLRKTLETYCPALKEKKASDFPRTYTIGDFVKESGLGEEELLQINRKIQEMMKSFSAIQEKEAKEFDPDVNLADDHYLWGTPENKEKCVESIEKRYAGRKGEIVFYGPSNITLWYSLEKDMLPYHAQNHGIGGCTDEDLMHYADRLLYPFDPKVVFFQTGSNDLAEGMTPEQVLSNKEKMYSLFLDKLPRAQLVVMSGLPLPGRTAFWDDTDRTNQYLREMCEFHERLHYMDATAAMMTDQRDERLKASNGRYFNPAYFRVDQIHLNVKGHAVWTALMKKELEELGIAPDET